LPWLDGTKANHNALAQSIDAIMILDSMASQDRLSQNNFSVAVILDMLKGTHMQCKVFLTKQQDGKEYVSVRASIPKN
jgi:hypothetical protein